MKTYTPNTSNDFVNDPTILDEPLVCNENGVTMLPIEPYLGDKTIFIAKKPIARLPISTLRPMKRIVPKK